MSWTAQVILDADKTDVGTAIAIWNEGHPDMFQYSRRAQISVAEGRAFAKEAIAAQREDVAKRSHEAPLATQLAAMLATEEAKS